VSDVPPARVAIELAGARNGDAFDADFVIVGSGFGGSVSALRLVEKGYRVLVLEAGRRWRTGEFPKTNWLIHKFLWLPQLGFYGIQRITLLKNVLVLSGAGVGGGSLVYANTLIEPPEAFFRDPNWAGLDNWKVELAPHYAEAKRMLGATRSRFLGPGDQILREVADELGVGDTFHQPDVAVYFGEPGKVAADPFFDGQGPERVGCVFCGGCMVGCNYGAKNTLDKNYLYLAEKAGAVVQPLTTVTGISPHPDGGYEVTTRRTGPFGGRGRPLRTRKVVLAGGVLGTVPLLLDCKRRGLLPALSARLGDYVRTSSSARWGAARTLATRAVSPSPAASIPMPTRMSKSCATVRGKTPWDGWAHSWSTAQAAAGGALLAFSEPSSKTRWIFCACSGRGAGPSAP